MAMIVPVAVMVVAIRCGNEIALVIHPNSMLLIFNDWNEVGKDDILNRVICLVVHIIGCVVARAPGCKGNRTKTAPENHTEYQTKERNNRTDGAAALR